MRYIIIFLLFTQTLIAQHQDHDDHSEIEHHDEHASHHSDHSNEIGIALSPVYFINEKETAFGLHVHYVYNIGESPFGIGAGYERIFDEHGHNTLGIVFNYRLLEALSFNFAPGVTFESGGDMSEEQETNFAFHIESTYEFELGDIHIGPALEFAYDPEDIHISLGLHIGLGF